MSLLPAHYPSPERAMERLPDILRGFYDLRRVNEFVVGCLGISFAISMVGMVLFSRRDV